MNPPRHCLIRAAAFALLVWPAACSVSTDGLGPSDGATDGTGGYPACPVGLTDQASWPANSNIGSCLRTCGPDDVGSQVCSQVDRTACQKRSGCVCLEAPCAACPDCSFVNPSECYNPTNMGNAPLCTDEVGKGNDCAPACGKRLCLRKDGKTACICNEHGKYACGDWGDSGWK
jgi:hypothetical protein